MTTTIAQLRDFLSENPSLVVLSGAGVSTESGIPDYRDRDGNWKHVRPIQYADFVGNNSLQRRYWARSYIGWQRFSVAQPNTAHHVLATLEGMGIVSLLITQNVDGLHRRAGSQRVIDLHGDLSQVRCLSCNDVQLRTDYQRRLTLANPGWSAEVVRHKPDGDAELPEHSYKDFVVPACLQCNGQIKPDVVMFGESVPKDRVAKAMGAVEGADALLVVGSSLMVFSGFRFARRANAQQKPIAIVNRGRTRADDIATLKVDQDCSQALSAALEGLTARA